MIKKILKVLVPILLVLALLAGIIYGVTFYRNKKNVADVYSVSYLQQGYWDSIESEGMVTSDADQNVFIEHGQIIKEVYVKEGQTVQEGDQLLSLDTTALELSLEMERLQLENTKNQLTTATKELERLKAMTPIPEKKEETLPVEDTTEAVLEEPVEEVQQVGYTADELRKKIKEKDFEVKKLDLQKRKAELSLQASEEAKIDGVIVAKINGTVKSVGSVDDIPNDGSPFLVVSGSDGLFIKGSISELLLDKIQIGQPVMARSFRDDSFYEATIASIETSPDDGMNYWGGGNPNVSNYSYTAFVENPQGLSNGDYLLLTIDNISNEGTALFISSAFVREENGKSYVFKEEDGVLKKQYVQTGRIGYGGYSIEIRSGITENDFIAFPYGKTAKEGVKTHESDDIMYY